MNNLKRILIFLGLKWDETLGKYPIHSTLFSITAIIVFIFCRIIDPYFILVDLVLSVVMGILNLVIYIAYDVISPDFYAWIKANWKKSGKILKEQNRNK